MPTFLFDKIIFGPVSSRRLGVSLGVNLLPLQSKFCNFNCVYCECGWTDYSINDALPSVDDVARLLEKNLLEMETAGTLPDVITFAGNGEPTLHPRFSEIIEVTRAVRDKVSPRCKITVLTNATMLHSQKVVSALLSIDSAFMKLDSAIPHTIQLLNKPLAPVKLDELLQRMRAFGDKLVIQTMFLRGEIDGKSCDNTSPDEIEALLDFYLKSQPSSVHLYSIARDTPLKGLEKISPAKLHDIAQFFRNQGVPVFVY